MVKFILFLGVLVHTAIAVWNGFFGPSPGAEGDALKFHLEALYYSNNLSNFEYITGFVYSYFLGLIYYLFTDHLFFGSMISVIIWLISANLVHRCLEIVGCEKRNIYIILLLYSIWPSALLNTSVTLREPVQALAINMIIFGVVRWIVNGKSGIIVVLSGMILASTMHGALLAYSGFLIGLSGYFIINIKYNINFLVRFSIVSVIAITGFAAALNVIGSVAYNLDDGILSALQSYNEGATMISSRADYRIEPYFSGIFDFLLFLPGAFFQYMLEPFPSRSTALADLAIFTENIIRFCLLISAVYVNRTIPESLRPWHNYVLIAYVAVEAVWAIGTVNWGTASRHHVPSFGILLLVALYRPQIISRASVFLADRPVLSFQRHNQFATR